MICGDRVFKCLVFRKGTVFICELGVIVVFFVIVVVSVIEIIFGENWIKVFY